MGNRATITTAPFDENNAAIYVHWSGGRDCVEFFLKAAKDLGYRSPGNHPAYCMARLTGLLCAYFGLSNDTSVGVGTVAELIGAGDDNGCYVIGGDWEIVERRRAGSGALMPLDSDERDGYDIDKNAAEIVAAVHAATSAAAASAKGDA
jgi:hypothetical protein